MLPRACAKGWTKRSPSSGSGCLERLQRSLATTNAAESLISRTRHVNRNVKRWREGQMALRWCAAGMVEASKQFRRVNGHLHLPALRAALQRHVAAGTVSADCDTQEVTAA